MSDYLKQCASLPRATSTRSRIGKTAPLSQTEGTLSIFHPPSAAGIAVSERSMLALSAVFACVRNLSEDEAKLPLITYKRTTTGRDRCPTHPAYRLLHTSANEEMTAFAMRQAVTATALLYGQGLAEIETLKNGKPAAIWPLEPWRSRIVRGGNKRLYVEQDGGATLEMANVLHIPGFSLDGIRGEMIADHGEDSIGLNLATQKFAATFFGNGAMPSLVLKSKMKLSPEAEAQALERFEGKNRGPRKANKTHILAEGTELEKVSFNPEESQAIEARQFGVEDVARWFRMPPHKIGHLLRATGWSTLEATNTDYITDTLLPWFVKWEQECGRKLFATDDIFCEHLVDAMLRGDSAARAALYKSLWEVGGINQNEIRQRENMNSLGAEGDKYYVPMNYRPTDQPFTPTPPPSQQR